MGGKNGHNHHEAGVLLPFVCEGLAMFHKSFFSGRANARGRTKWCSSAFVPYQHLHANIYLLRKGNADVLRGANQMSACADNVSYIYIWTANREYGRSKRRADGQRSWHPRRRYSRARRPMKINEFSFQVTGSDQRGGPILEHTLTVVHARTLPTV